MTWHHTESLFKCAASAVGRVVSPKSSRASDQSPRKDSVWCSDCALSSFAFVFLFSCLMRARQSPRHGFFAVAVRAGARYLIKNSYYARCNTRNLPIGMNCPGVVFGIGFSRNQAQNAARAYAEFFGDAGCGMYVGHCQIKKWRRGKTRIPRG